MKDTIITAKQKKKELLILASCFLLANLMNAYGITIKKTAWIELLTQLPVVLLITLFFYVLLGLLRLLATGFKQLVNRPRN